MSSTLMYAPKPISKKPLGLDIKRAITKHYCFNGGQICLGEDAVGFLNGLLCAGIDDASVLLEVIEKHGSVNIYLEY